MAWDVEIDDVVAGEPIESAWGNEIRDKIVHIMPTLASLPTTGIAEGSVAWVEAANALYTWDGVAWTNLGKALAKVDFRTINTSVANNVADIVVWNGTTLDQLPGVVRNSGVYTVNTPGLYKIESQVGWDGTNDSGRREVEIRKQAARIAIARQAGLAGTGDDFVYAAAPVTHFDAGQTFDVRVLQASGAALNYLGGATATWISIAYLGPSA